MENVPFLCEVTLRWYQHKPGFDWELRHLGRGDALASIWESEDDEDDTDQPYAWATFCTGRSHSGGADSVEEAKAQCLKAMGIRVITEIS